MKTARRQSKEGGNHLEQESTRQKTAETFDEGLHPAVDRQSLGERRKVKDERCLCRSHCISWTEKITDEDLQGRANQEPCRHTEHGKKVETDQIHPEEACRQNGLAHSDLGYAGKQEERKIQKRMAQGCRGSID